MNHLNVGPGLLSEIFKRFKENGVRFVVVAWQLTVINLQDIPDISFPVKYFQNTV